MEIIEYQNTTGDKMILLLDIENDKATSMTKETYDEQQARQLGGN
jgi:hypothetical protein